MRNCYNYITVLAECEAVGVVGGKGANLGRMVGAGFPVPGGFVVDTRGYRRAQEMQNAECRIQKGEGGVGGAVAERVGMPVEVREEIVGAYREMGGGAVAVRSSATAEDMEGASMAGQYETYLDVCGEEELIRKVEECWASLDVPRVRAYLAEHGIEQSQVGMAVVVQKMVAAEVAGVMFTVDPLKKGLGDRGKGIEEMVIEASWGLGESVVGGKVQPDVVRVDGATGAVVEMEVADKRVELVAGTREERVVEERRRKRACLGAEEVRKLWELGKKVEGYFGMPMDVEWAIAGGAVYLLQSRPITTVGSDATRREGDEGVIGRMGEVRTELKKWLGAGRGPWVLHNLAETLSHPTPLTWSVMKRFMSGAGGFGAMYRMAGFEPSARVCQEGFLDLIAGRIYMDVSRAPEMFFERFPFAYDLEELKRNPEASQNPPTVPTGKLRERMRVGKRLAAASAKLRGVAEEFDRTLREVHFQAMAAYVAGARQTDLCGVSHAQLVELWQRHEKWVMDEFAPLSLLPSMICGMALGELTAFLEEHLWDEDGEALADLLSSGGVANRTVMADAELYEVGRELEISTPRHQDTKFTKNYTEDTESTENHRGGDEKNTEQSGKDGELDVLNGWIEAHGHRAPGEFELGVGRWRERVEEVREMAVQMARGGERPLERHGRVSEEVRRRVEEVRGKLRGKEVEEFDQRLEMVRRYVPFREDGKDYLMMGYELLREVAVEMGRRLDIGGDVVYLTKGEMMEGILNAERGTLKGDKGLREIIAERKGAYLAEGKVEVPRVVDGEWVEGMGNEGNGDGRLKAELRTKGFVLSGGGGGGHGVYIGVPEYGSVVDAVVCECGGVGDGMRREVVAWGGGGARDGTAGGGGGGCDAAV
jgi:pyruvate,water dikinase